MFSESELIQMNTNTYATSPRDTLTLTSAAIRYRDRTQPTR